tara:strand:- start:15132 stop:15989 length:858 start_codon:yes stop_codon:yes gene_type:complete
LVNKKNILITGSNGQLGSCLKKISDNYNYSYFFKKKKELDITNSLVFEKFLTDKNINTIINCAAYTDVNGAEINKELSDKINNQAIEYIAKLCSELDIQLIHISTDYVFDGNNDTPYQENDITNPLNNYGKSKLMGEQKILDYNLPGSIIIRTSWLYSKSKNNFVSKILKKISSGMNISVAVNEIGSPTNAVDLAKTILNILPRLNNKKTEVFHYSNLGECSRFEFACEINKLVNGNAVISPVISLNDNIKRPNYSALSSQKLIDYFGIKINNWDTSLKNLLTDN